MASKIVRFTCPQCQKKLKTDRPVEAGQKTSCPFCGCILALPMPEVGPSASNIIQAYVPKSEQQPSPGTAQQPNHYPAPAQPAKNPLIYALGGAALMLLLGGGMWAAYNAGRGNAQPLADGNQVAAANPPVNEAPPTQPTNPSQQPTNNTNKPGGSSSPPATKSNTTAAPQQPKPTDTPAQPKPAPPKPKPRDDSNRPKNSPQQPAQPEATVNPPLIVEVPVFIPLGDIHSSRKSGKPDLQVLIRPKNSLHTIPTLDHLTPPGLDAVLLVSLDKKPKTTVTVNVTDIPTGLVVTPTSLEFSPNIRLEEQELTITGNAPPGTTTRSTKIFYLEMTATGGGLQASGPARIPVKVRRRASFQTDSGKTLVRSASPLTDWIGTGTIGTNPFTGLPTYKDKYVELTDSTGVTYHLYDNYYQDNSSGTLKTIEGGSWR